MTRAFLSDNAAPVHPLVWEAMRAADARAEGFKIDPRCSYVEVMFRRHKEWGDLRA